MLTTSRIHRLAESEEYDRLLTAVLANGRALPLPARVRLSQPESLRAAALGLGLLRLVELSHRPTDPIAGLLTSALLEEQEDSGRFGNLASTVVAVAALESVRNSAERGFRGAGSGAAPAQPRIDTAIERALHALYGSQGGLADGNGLIGDEIDSALALWLLGRSERFRAAVDFEALKTSLADSDTALDAAADRILALAGAGGRGGPRGRLHPLAA